MSKIDSWLLPDGIDEVLPQQARFIEKSRRELLDLYNSWGYDLVIPPMVEFTESLLSGFGSDLDLVTFRLTDQLSGRMMGIRADITPQAARIDAHSLNRQGPSRLCYAGTVLQTKPRAPLESRTPISIGVELFGEAGIGATQGGISTNTTIEGTGYNSDNYNYQFFNVDDYIVGTQCILKFSTAGVTTNPGIAKTFQSGYATLINKKKYPVIEPVQSRGVFELKETLIIDDVITDLKVIEVRKDYIKIDGKYKIKTGDRIKGELSNVSAEITSIVDNQAKFTTDFSNRQEYGWLDDIGKLNEDYQVIPDNDYYQNLSYTVKSSIEWEKFVNPVNRLVHPSGLKNFADTSVVSNLKVGVGEVRESNQTVVLDVGNILELRDKQRVDAINNFDLIDIIPPDIVFIKVIFAIMALMSLLHQCFFYKVKNFSCMYQKYHI